MKNKPIKSDRFFIRTGSEQEASRTHHELFTRGFTDSSLHYTKKSGARLWSRAIHEIAVSTRPEKRDAVVNYLNAQVIAPEHPVTDYTYCVNISKLTRN